jgi:hypothetical protein
MMNAQPLDSRRRLLALTYPTTSAQTPHACRPRPSPRIPRTGYRDPTAGLTCLPSRKGSVPALDGSSLCRANVARVLRCHFVPV